MAWKASLINHRDPIVPSLTSSAENHGIHRRSTQRSHASSSSSEGSGVGDEFSAFIGRRGSI